MRLTLLAVPATFRPIQNKFIVRLGALLCFALLLSPAILLAQNATTSLRGTVTDPDGAAVPGATVTLTNLSNNQKLIATSNGSGEYQLVQIAPAKYSISSKAPGFGTQTRTAALLVNQPATVNFKLSITASEVVDVSTATETLNTTDASLGNAKDNALIQALPSEERNVPDLLSLQPGVFFLPPPSDPALADSRSGTVNGVRSDQSNITLDGIDDNDQVRGLAFFGTLRVTQDSVEEFRVITGNANADAGRASGAQVSLVTKSGTNKPHGALYWYNRPSNTVSNDFINKNSQINEGASNRPPKLIRNIFGGDFGGPIIKDKLFIFGNYEGQRQAESSEVIWEVPNALYRAGTLSYTDTSGNIDQITPAQLAILDAGCTVCNTTAYPPPPGVNPNILNYFAGMPASNGLIYGDGINDGSYSFSSPNPRTLNTTVVRIDYIPTPKHRIFARGGLQKDVTGGVENFPGQGPSYNLVDNTKGMIFGDTWTITSSLVNDIRYGYIRQAYGNTGKLSGDYVYVDMHDINVADEGVPIALTPTTIFSVPVNNIVDNLNWTKGHHSLQFGVNWRLVHQNHLSNASSFSNGVTDPDLLNSDPAPDPQTIGLPQVDPSSTTNYKRAYANLVGTVTNVNSTYNYQIVNPTTATLLPDGAPLARHYSSNEYEAYIQDQWRVKPKVTLTFGVRYTLLQTPWETRGQQVAPTIDTHAWYLQREAAAQLGQIYEPDLSFAPNGKFFNKPGFYPQNKGNFAPRFAVAYAPDNKTSIRAGYGIYYSHFGEALIAAFDQDGGEFGLASSATSDTDITNTENTPRFLGMNTLPYTNGSGPATATFPFTPADSTGPSAYWGIDSRIKTPYIQAFDFSIQRELGHGFTLEAAYVGRIGKHLLQQLDMAQPVDYVDPAGGGDYFTAGTLLSKYTDMNGGDGSAAVPAIPYFENVFPYMANFGCPGGALTCSATQAIYTNEWAPNRGNGGLGASTAIEDVDLTGCGFYPCPAGHQSRFYQNQFASMYALSSIGTSSYHSLQITLSHPMSHGLQMDFSYTFAKSMDMGSDAERATEYAVGVGTAFSQIFNTWNPKLNKAVSDFDTKSAITTNWVYQLPFGKGRMLLGESGGIMNSIIGGWQLSGLFRWTSGLPFGVVEPAYTTDWNWGSYTTDVGNTVKTHRHFDPTTGDYAYFDNPSQIANNSTNGVGLRMPYPGEAGQRNHFRGDGYLDLDSGLSKAWGVRYGSVKFTWEVYNVTNTNRFDPIEIGATLYGGSFGNASTTLGNPRRMQFSLRYDF